MTDKATVPANRPDRLGPHSIEAEEAVLGSVLINPDVMTEISDVLKPDDFYELKHSWLWESMQALYDRGDEIDNLTVVEELRRRKHLQDSGGPAYVAYLINNTPTYLYAETYARIVQRAAIRRGLIRAAGQIAQLAMEDDADVLDVISRAESTLFGVTEEKLRKDVIPMSQAVREYFDRVEQLYNNPNEAHGVPTYFTDLDQLLGGLQKSDLIIVAARPGVGKTSFLLSIALNAARKASARVAIFSLEMGREQLVQRFFASETQISSHRLRTGRLEEGEWDRFIEAADKLDPLRIYIDDTPGLSVQQMRARCRRLYREHGIDLILLDYLQLMNAGVSTGRDSNRVQEVSAISRGLKELARELNVPVIAAAQLSRAVEQRSDKRPQLSDLRESGCLAGDTLVTLADGRRIPIRKLAGMDGFHVPSLDAESWCLQVGTVSHAFSTGVKPVFRLSTQLGRTIRATGNHQFLTMDGWKRLDELMAGDYIALPRQIPTANAVQSMSDAELGLLGHLIGDGCTLARHVMQYTTREFDLAETVTSLASTVFGASIAPRINKERDWYQVYFPATFTVTHQTRNPIALWLTTLGVFNLRSYEKYIPKKVFLQPAQAIACFLRHLWSTDGCIAFKGSQAIIYYATSSVRLASDVQSLLLRLGVNARLKRVPQVGKGRDQYHVIITGIPDLRAFLEQVGTVGAYKTSWAQKIRDYIDTHESNPNKDIVPYPIWRKYAVHAMRRIGMTNREMQKQMGNAYCGTGLYKQNVSRVRAARLATVVQSREIELLSASDVYWDPIAEIVPDGEEEVFDLTVPTWHNFVANDIIVHNSIEQDADIVAFLYRDDLYNEASDRPNQADVIIAKHRNGPTGTISLFFRKDLTQFVDMVKSNINLSEY